MSGALNAGGASRRLGFLSAVSLCALAGCIDRAIEGQTNIYTYSLWLVMAALIGGMALIYFGSSPRPTEPRGRGYFGIVLGIGLIAVAVPVLRTDRVEVDKEHFTCTSGLPWSHVRYDVQFKAVREIRIETTEKSARSQGRKNYNLICRFKSGKEEKVPVGIVMRDALKQILGFAEQRGVSLVGVEQLPQSMRPQ